MNEHIQNLNVVQKSDAKCLGLYFKFHDLDLFMFVDIRVALICGKSYLYSIYQIVTMPNNLGTEPVLRPRKLLRRSG